MARNVVDEPNEDIVASANKDRAALRGPFGRIALFLRQVMGELRKVVTPTRKELINYTGVVLVFVIIMIGLVYGFDTLFSWVVINLFGSTGTGG